MINSFKLKKALPVLLGIAGLSLAACGRSSPSSASIEHGGHTTTTAGHAHVVTTPINTQQVYGLAGQFVWKMSNTTGLQTSSDSGTHWTNVPLPASFGTAQNTSIPQGTDIQGAATGDLWLATPSGNNLALYHHKANASSWVEQTLDPQWPADATMGTPSTSVVIGTDGNIGVIAVRPPDFTGGDVSLLFMSSDNGISFGPSIAMPGLGDWSIALGSSEGAVAVSQNAMDEVYATTDAGKTWTKTAIPTNVNTTDIKLNPPIYFGNAFYMVAGVGTLTSTYELLRSTNGGASFSVLGTPGSQGKESNGFLPSGFASLAINSNNIWIAPEEGGIIYESSDGGSAWTTVTGNGLPNGLGDLSLLSADHAVVKASVVPPGCSGLAGKSPSCAIQTFTYETSDGGKDWTSHPLGSVTSSAPLVTTTTS